MDMQAPGKRPLALLTAVAAIWAFGTTLAAGLFGNITAYLLGLPGIGLAVVALAGLALIAVQVRKLLAGELHEIDSFPKSAQVLAMLRLVLLGALVPLAAGWLLCAALDLKLSQAFLTALVFTVLVSTGLSLLGNAVVNLQLAWRFRRSPRAIPPV